MQADPIEPTLKVPGSKQLKQKHDKLLSILLQFCFNFAFDFNLRRYTESAEPGGGGGCSLRGSHDGGGDRGNHGGGGADGTILWGPADGAWLDSPPPGRGATENKHSTTVDSPPPRPRGHGMYEHPTSR